MDEGRERILNDENYPQSVHLSDNVDKGCVSHPGRGPLGGNDDLFNDKNPKPLDYPRMG